MAPGRPAHFGSASCFTGIIRDERARTVVLGEFLANPNPLTKPVRS
jgi:hypothetical protein